MDRFWSKVDRYGECWLWLASTSGKGYGTFHFRGRCTGAHRVAYILCVGEVPQGTELDHKCRNRRCVRPDHLEAVSHAENVRRGLIGITAATKNICRNGHRMSAANTVGRRGQERARFCLECRRRSKRDWYHRSKAGD